MQLGKLWTIRFGLLLILMFDQCKDSVQEEGCIPDKEARLDTGHLIRPYSLVQVAKMGVKNIHEAFIHQVPHSRGVQLKKMISECEIGKREADSVGR